MIRIWEAYREKVLPEPGGYYDQPAALMEALRHMSATFPRIPPRPVERPKRVT